MGQFQSSGEEGEAERFGQIVVHAGGEAALAFFGHHVGGESGDVGWLAGVREGADAVHGLEAVHLGQPIDFIAPDDAVFREVNAPGAEPGNVADDAQQVLVLTQFAAAWMEDVMSETESASWSARTQAWMRRTCWP